MKKSKRNRGRSRSPSKDADTLAQIEALRASVEKMSLRFMSQEGQQIGGCYNNALIPAEYFRDDLAAFLVRENFAATLNSASDKAKAKI
jgi:hypothetical protein